MSQRTNHDLEIEQREVKERMPAKFEESLEKHTERVELSNRKGISEGIFTPYP